MRARQWWVRRNDVDGIGGQGEIALVVAVKLDGSGGEGKRDGCQESEEEKERGGRWELDGGDESSMVVKGARWCSERRRERERERELLGFDLKK